MDDDTPRETSDENEPEKVSTEETIQLKNLNWIEDKRLGDGPIQSLDDTESMFFKELITEYLFPMNNSKDEQEKVHMGLIVSEQDNSTCHNKTIIILYLYRRQQCGCSSEVYQCRYH